MPSIRPTPKKFSPLDQDVGNAEVLIDDELPGGSCSTGDLFYNTTNSTLYVCVGGSWEPIVGPEGVVDEYIALIDTPNSYAGHANRFVAINAAEDGTEHITGTAATARLDNFVGANPSTAGTKGLVPAPLAGQQQRFLRGDGTWATALQVESEVVREIADPIGASNSLNDLWVNVATGNMFYNNGATWSPINIPDQADGYVVLPSGVPATPGEPTDTEAQIYVTSTGVIGGTVLIFVGTGTTADPEYAWFVDVDGIAIRIKDPSTAGADGEDGLSITWRGAYNSGTTYAINDAVSYLGSSYISIQNSNTNHTPTPGDWWNLLAAKGDTGAAGTNGTNGSNGTNGTNGISFIWRGTYNGSTNYSANDVVAYLGQTYIALQATVGNLPTGLSPNWALMAAKGADGSNGSNGTNGTSFTWEGTWSSLTAYQANDVVYYQGQSWIAKITNTNVTPAAGATWDLVAAKGTDGADGADGAGVSYATMVQGSHGFVSTDVGKALFGHAVWDDTLPDQWFTGVLTEIIDTDSFKYAAEGQNFDFPATLLGVSYNIASDGRFLYWDASLGSGHTGRWVKNKPGDSDPSAPVAIMVNSYDSGTETYNATMLGLGPNPW